MNTLAVQSSAPTPDDDKFAPLAHTLEKNGIVGNFHPHSTGLHAINLERWVNSLLAKVPASTPLRLWIENSSGGCATFGTCQSNPGVAQTLKGADFGAELRKDQPLKNKKLAEPLKRIFEAFQGMNDPEKMAFTTFKGYGGSPFQDRVGQMIQGVKALHPNVSVRLEPTSFPCWVAYLEAEAHTFNLVTLCQKSDFPQALRATVTIAEKLSNSGEMRDAALLSAMRAAPGLGHIIERGSVHREGLERKFAKSERPFLLDGTADATSWKGLTSLIGRGITSFSLQSEEVSKAVFRELAFVYGLSGILAHNPVRSQPELRSVREQALQIVNEVPDERIAQWVGEIQSRAGTPADLAYAMIGQARQQQTDDLRDNRLPPIA